MFVPIVVYTVALYTLQNPISEYPFEQHVQSKQRRIEMNEKIKNRRKDGGNPDYFNKNRQLGRIGYGPVRDEMPG